MPNASGYDEQVVAFIDLLGFREAITDQARQPAILDLLKSIASTRGELEVETEIITDPQQLLKPPARQGFPNFIFAMAGQRSVARPAITAFSDSIVISFSLDELRTHEMTAGDAVSLLKYIVSYLSWKSLDIGLLIRGDIALGRLHHHDGIVAGDALVSAYEIETKIAIYPRVVLSESIMEHPDYTPLSHFLSYVDYDGMHCLDYMPDALQRINPGLTPYIKPRVEFARKLIAEHLSKFDETGDLTRRAKWAYFSHYLESTVMRYAALMEQRH